MSAVRDLVYYGTLSFLPFTLVWKLVTETGGELRGTLKYVLLYVQHYCPALEKLSAYPNSIPGRRVHAKLERAKSSVLMQTNPLLLVVWVWLT